MAILLVEQNMKLGEAVANKLHIMVKVHMVYRATPDVFCAEEPFFGRAFSPRDASSACG